MKVIHKRIQEYLKEDTGAPNLLYNAAHHLIKAGGKRVRSLIAILMFVVAGIIGIYQTFLSGITILVLGGIGILFGFFYYATPVKLASRGLGEPIVGLNFGVLLSVGSYYVHTQSIIMEPIIASIPVALLIIGVLWINEFPDYNADKGAGNLTLVVRIVDEMLQRYIQLLS